METLSTTVIDKEGQGDVVVAADNGNMLPKLDPKMDEAPFLGEERLEPLNNSPLEAIAVQKPAPKKETMARTPLVVKSSSRTSTQKTSTSRPQSRASNNEGPPPPIPGNRRHFLLKRHSSHDLTVEQDALDNAMEAPSPHIPYFDAPTKKKTFKPPRPPASAMTTQYYSTDTETSKEALSSVDEPTLSTHSSASASSTSGKALALPPPLPPPPPPPQLPNQRKPAIIERQLSGVSQTNPSAQSTPKKKTHKDVPRIKAEEARGDGDEGVDDRIRLGICAMDKKARSKPMAEILSRLDETLFRVIFFGDDTILNRPPEEWPICDVLVAFFSKGYPLDKAKEYVALRKPIILNDLDMQETLQDRRRVYDLLEESGIDVPRHAYLSRDGYVSTGTGNGNGMREQELQEFDDHIEVNGMTINKPFVEKPVNAEDHNIAIYYPTSAGGGCKKLFRKVGNRSSEFYPDINEVRRDGSYIYEEFVETQGTDVKMYTVGPDYGHAEARKSPTVDGKVERNSDGKEVRFPVILTFREKEIARRIVIVFKQFVCGFDILRVQEGDGVVSYVCDVNGWSFVKNSRKYYDDASTILAQHMLATMKPDALTAFSTLDPLVTTNLNHPGDDDASESGSVKSLTSRKHGFLSRATRFLQGGDPDSFSDDGSAGDTDTQSLSSLHNLESQHQSPSRSGETTELLSTAAATLIEGALPVRELPDNLTSEPASLNPSTTGSMNGKSSTETEDEDGFSEEISKRRGSISLRGSQSQSHQEELRCVLAIVRHGDRTPKQKLKVNMTEPHILEYFHKHCKDCKSDLKVKAKAPLTEFLETVKTTLAELASLPMSRQKSGDSQESGRNIRVQLTHMRDILERWKIHGLNRKLQIKPQEWEDFQDPVTGEITERCTKVQLILKWGGNLTKLGEKQAIALGHQHRHVLYPDAPGGGILRLHSTFRHDLKIKTSDEGRVMKTAAAFAKGLLELEGDLPPILVSLVHKEKGSMHMLDPTGNKEVKKDLDILKEKITANLQRDINIAEASEEDLNELVGPPQLTSLRKALQECGNPRKILHKIHRTMGELIHQLEEMLDEMGSGDERRIEGGEGLQGKDDDDVALSGVKLYKGETLLELTERWRFIYDRLYDADTDKFDLSRIPDVHDNVRFDVLHNPHLGLSETLQKLYNYAKPMADCVVPQEYGSTLAEKRDVSVKICHELLEKINNDLNVARTDNKVDMRYLINMKYEADLPITTMGRRIRTRLYFTSESHLHTVLNVFRFAKCNSKGLLSEHGCEIINATPELCYLTQIVMRVFEDNRRRLDDPRRFRVEILFSPGAAATPLHIDEDEREHDAARYGTEPLQQIGREGLTCAEVEAFLEQAIMAGKVDEEAIEAANVAAKKDKKKKKKDKKEGKDGAKTEKVVAEESGSSKAIAVPATDDVLAPLENKEPKTSDEVAGNPSSTDAKDARRSDEEANEIANASTVRLKNKTSYGSSVSSGLGMPDWSVPPLKMIASRESSGSGMPDWSAPPMKTIAAPSLPEVVPAPVEKQDQVPPDLGVGDLAPNGTGRSIEMSLPGDIPNEDRKKEGDLTKRKMAERKYFWGSIAVVSIALGVSCLMMAVDMAQGRRRRWATHRF